jgi:hypothetical protein
MTTSSHRRFPLFALLAVATLFATPGNANDKKVERQNVEPNEVEVLGKIPLTNGPITGFLAMQHYLGLYLYAEHEGGRLTLIDVTDAREPVVLADVAAGGGANTRTPPTVAGTAVHIRNEVGNAQGPQTIRIMDFSDPRNPKVAWEFPNITAMSKDTGRGLIFLADHQNIWVLHQRFGQDPLEQQAYHDYVLYGSK